MQLPEPDEARAALGAVTGAFASGAGFTPVQRQVFDALTRDLYDIDAGTDPIVALSPMEFLAQGADPELRRQAVSLMAVLELAAHPLPPATADAVSAYAHTLGVNLEALNAARLLADNHAKLMYADLQRSSWYARETVKGMLHGQFMELLESKLAHTGLLANQAIADKWLALRDCPAGSWGRGVAEFYEANSFPFPGTRHGIFEIGARHDFVHVLADYDPTPAGELDVFGFIAATMPGTDGLVLLAVTLGIFQNGSITRVAGKRVRMARTDTLSDPGAADHFAEALRRGRLTTVDVMGGVDHFAHAARPLAEVRAEFNVVPTRDAHDADTSGVAATSTD